MARAHTTVCHSAHEWARDDDGIREVHCNTCEGAGTALRTYLQAFRSVHKAHVHRYVAAYEALLNTKQVTAVLIRRMCFGDLHINRRLEVGILVGIPLKKKVGTQYETIFSIIPART